MVGITASHYRQASVILTLGWDLFLFWLYLFVERFVHAKGVNLLLRSTASQSRAAREGGREAGEREKGDMIAMNA